MTAEPVICAAGWASARVIHFLAPVAVSMAMMSAPVCVPMTSVVPSTTGSLRETEPAIPLYEETSRRQMTWPLLALTAEM
jgi:hypothetical protein